MTDMYRLHGAPRPACSLQNALRALMGCAELLKG